MPLAAPLNHMGFIVIAAASGASQQTGEGQKQARQVIADSSTARSPVAKLLRYGASAPHQEPVEC
jgi:hypothetical protein